jgi:Flp pilus assembly protein TadG
MARSRSGERGATIVEIAALLPFLTLLLLGIVEVGRYAYFSILVENAARAGAQYAIQNGQTAENTVGIQSAALADANSSIGALTVTSSYACECWNGSGYTPTSCSGPPSCGSAHAVDLVTVTVNGTIHSLFNYYVLPASFATTATTTMRVAQP